MARFTLVNRAWMNTGTTGTGTVTLASALTGYQTFAAAGVTDQEVVHVCFIDGAAWEESVGVYSATGTTLTRSLVASSTGSLLNLSSSATVFVTLFAQDIVNGVGLQPADSVIGGAITVEDAATNLCLGSNDLSNGTYWTVTNLAATANSAESPDGGTNATLLTTGSNAQETVQTSSSATISSGTNYAASVYAKAGSGVQWLVLSLMNAAGTLSVSVWFDIINGVIGTNSTTGASLVGSAIFPLGNGWWRLGIAGNFADVTATVQLAATSANSSMTWSGGSGQTFYGWGADLVLGSAVRSHISTGSNAVTCSVGANIDGAAIVPAGSASSPSVRIGATAGLYSSGPNLLDVSIGGVQAGEFSSSGLNLPSGAAFSIGGSPVVTGAIPTGQCYLSLLGASTATAVTSGSTASGSSTIVTAGTSSLTSGMVSIGNTHIADGTVITVGGSNILLSAPITGGSISSGTTLTFYGVLQLMPYNGRYLMIGGANYAIPSAGVTLSPVGLSASTFYYIYAHGASGNILLEASTTGHKTDTATGVEIKSGDSSRSLVGAAYLVSGPAFIDSTSKRYVTSWYNPRANKCISQFTSTRTTTATSYAEINSEIRAYFLVLGPAAASGAGNTTYQWAINGTVSNSSTYAGVYTTAAFDGTTAETEMSSGEESAGSGTGNNIPLGISGGKALAEGSHYITLLGFVGAGAGYWYSNSPGGGSVYTSCQVITLG